MGLINWVKRNKLATLLLLVLGYLFLRSFLSSFLGVSNMSFNVPRSSDLDYAPSSAKMSLPGIGGGGSNYYPNNPAPPTTDVTNRMVVQNSYLSLVVTNVAKTLTEIKTYATSIGGYMVSSDLSNPQDNTNGNISLRLPSEKLEAALAKFRTLAVKVASERLNGTDVTDQYVDNEARMAVLNANMARFKELMAQAKEISDILKIQQDIFSLQSQIDSIKGQNKYMEQTAKMSLVTVYLSTDEFSLPYAPSAPWRPDVIFKTAVRSLIGSLRSLASIIIWVAVYSPIWLPVLLVGYFLKKRRRPPLPPVN